jgi:hypothetical protein
VATVVAAMCWSTRKRTEGVRRGLEETVEWGGGAHRGREVAAAASIPHGVATALAVEVERRKKGERGLDSAQGGTWTGERAKRGCGV